MFIRTVIIVSFLMFISIGSKGQETAFFIKNIYQKTLADAQCDQWLQYLSDSIGGRLTGSHEAELAVDYTYRILKSLDIVDTVFLQPCTVPVWIRGDREIVRFKMDKTEWEVEGLSLGNSIGTGPDGIQAGIIEVFSLDTLELLGEENIKDKIVFFNRPMSPLKIRTFEAYGEAVDQRVHGASRASKYGAKAVIIRSISNSIHDYPHTGVLSYAEGVPPIPAIAISTADADRLSHLMKENAIELYIQNHAHMQDSVTSYNVIAEIEGHSFPDEIILVGGHLDSWDVGGGAHDDGAGCVHAMQVLATLNKMDYHPKRTIRCVMFMNEENGLAGGKAYAKWSNVRDEFHLAAIESDRGGFTPRGFACSAMPEVFPGYLSNFQKFDTWFSPYDIYLKAGGGGADIGPLKSQGGLLIGFIPDQQRYFDFHHTKEDVFSNVNIRELRLGAAAITSLVYLIDQLGL